MNRIPPLSHIRPKEIVLTFLLLSIAIAGPMVAYAGVSVIYPESTLTADVDESPPISFSAGGDHATAQTVGFAGAVSTADNGGSFTLTVNGLSGGNVTIDKLMNASVDSSVASFKMEVSTAYSGTLTPDVFALRFWTGTTAPTADGSTGVCAILDLMGGTAESSGSCGADVDVQVILELPSGVTTESGTVSLRPSSVTFS